MIIIKKQGKEFRVPNDSFLALQDTSDGMYFKFKDATELRIECPVTAQVKAATQIIMNAKAKDITLDFDRPDKLISIG
jgi:hypothetical protein